MHRPDFHHPAAHNPCAQNNGTLHNAYTPYDYNAQQRPVSYSEEEVRQAFRRARPFRSLSEFLIATNPSQAHKGCCLHGKCCACDRALRKQQRLKSSTTPPHNPDSNGQANPPGEAENAAPRRKPRCTKAEKRRRLLTLARFLEASATPQQIYEYAKTHWGIGRRSVQLYLRHIKRCWAAQASRADYLAALWKSHKQHEALIFKAFQVLDKLNDPKLLAHVLRTLERLIKARDDNFANIVEHRRATRRDHSLDRIPAKCLRGQKVTFRLDELLERIAHLRDVWFQVARQELGPFAAQRGQDPVGEPPAPQPTEQDQQAADHAQPGPTADAATPHPSCCASPPKPPLATPHLSPVGERWPRASAEPNEVLEDDVVHIRPDIPLSELEQFFRRPAGEGQ